MSRRPLAIHVAPVVTVADAVSLGRLKAVQLQVHIRVQRVRAPKRLHETVPALRTMELPRHPRVLAQAVGRQRIEVAAVVAIDVTPCRREAADRGIVEILLAHVETPHDTRRGVAPERVRLDRCPARPVVRRAAPRDGSRAVIRNPRRKRVRDALRTDGVEHVVAPPERHRTAKRLQVVPGSTGCARIDLQIRMPPTELVPSAR
jgi:hypothetical protein